ncbi:MAG: STAS domain-containing protein [Proteobacteria bacterium]|nr:STAS domain-containing protein [Pseudomonadota bacterium]
MKHFQPSGTLKLDTAAAQLATLPSLGQGELLEVDLSQISAVDSAGVAVLLHWLRSARQQGAELRFANLPASLLGFIRLYDVDTLLPLANQAES